MITKIIDEELIQQAKADIEAATEIVIVTHVSPDGDAMGASLGFSLFLQTIEKKVSVIVPNSFPDFLKWMPGASDVIVYTEQSALADQLVAKADLICALDFNVLKRIEGMALCVADAPGRKLLIDHHLQPGSFADVVISYPQIASTAEMIFRLICRMGYFTDMTEECAECIYTGMMTDTGAFSFNSNSAEIYSIVSELIKKGINKDEIYSKVYNNYSADRFRLMGYMLNQKMKIYPEYGTALLSLSQDELIKYNYKKGDTEGFVNLPLSIKGIVFVAFFKEEGGKIKLSFRSQGDVPTNEFAAKFFNGGGHKNASGGEMLASLDDAIALFEKEFPILKDKLEAEIKQQLNEK